MGKIEGRRQAERRCMDNLASAFGCSVVLQVLRRMRDKDGVKRMVAYASF